MTLAMRLGLHFSPTTLYFALSLPRISFASLASVVYVGWDLMVRYLCYEACWPVLERFEYFCLLLNTSSAILSSDKVYQSPQTRPTPDMVRHSISQCTILSLDTPVSYTASIMHSSGTCLSF